MTTIQKQKKQARVYAPTEYAVKRHVLPQSWKNAIGILTPSKRREMERHLTKVRNEWR